MKDKLKANSYWNTQMCDLMKSVDKGDDTLTKIDKCLMQIDKLTNQCNFEKLTIGNEDE